MQTQNLAHQIVDVTMLALTNEPFAVLYPLPGGGALSVARSTLGSAAQARFLSSAIVDVYGELQDSTVDNWQSAYDVADRLMTLHGK